MASRPYRIAVLDDEPEMRKALRRLLITQGYEVELFADAAHLLAALGKPGPDCVLLDLHLTGMTGIDVLHHLARRDSPPPVIVITGQDEEDTESRVRRLGAVAYLRKPVDESHLFPAITEALGARRPGPLPLFQP